MIYVILCALVGTGFSPEGELPLDYVTLDAGSGVTFDQIMDIAQVDADTVENIEPGVLPEGDYLMDVVFTNDGSKVLVCNYMTENVTVMDRASMSIDTTVAGEGNPGGIACSDEYAVIALPFSDKVEVYSLADASLAGSFSTGEQPWVVRVSENGEHAYVGCDIDNVCEVIDLAGMTHENTIADFPVWLSGYTFGSEGNRFMAKFSGFEILPGDTLIAVGDGETSLLFIDPASGSVEYSLAIADCDGVALSGDGQYLVALSAGSTVTLHRVDLSTFTVDASVAVTGYTVGMTREIAVNQDGSKAFISTSSNTSTLVDFLDNEFVTFTSTYSAFWVGVSYDHSLAISGQYRFSVIDFDTESMVAQYQGNSQYMGCVSPVDNYAAGVDPVGHEGVYFYSFSGSSANYLGDVLSGSPVEGDGSRRCAISEDGTVAVVSNTLSDNVSIVDMTMMETVAVLEIGDRVQDVAITSDSKYAVVCGFNSNSVMIIDLDTSMIVADVPTGSRSGVVSITPDDGYAYVGNISSNSVSVVQLDGASSVEVAEIPCGTIGVTWAATGVSSDVRVSPSGDYCLVAASFDDKVKVIDTATNTIVADLAVGDFPLQIAFNADGSKAIVSNYSGDTYSVIDVDGASSSVMGTWSAGDGPLRVAYDEISDLFAIGLYLDDAVKTVDPSTGLVEDTYSYASSGHVVDLDYTYTLFGNRLVLTAGDTSTPARIHWNDEYEDLSAGPVFFDYCDWTCVALGPVPGPDYAIYIDLTPMGLEEHEIQITGMPGLSLGPNPGNGNFSFTVQLPSAGMVELGVYDLSGRLVSEVYSDELGAGSHSLNWEGDVPAGVYAVRLSAGGRVVSKLLTVCR